MAIKAIKYSNYKEFLTDILPTGKLGKSFNGFVFRGESTNKYKLLPSALRIENIEKLWGEQIQKDDVMYEWESMQISAEYNLLRNFYKLANHNGLKVPQIETIKDDYMNFSPDECKILKKGNKWLSKEFTELAALAQHYGMLSRLLDWTYDSFIAIYFACIGAMKNKERENDMMVIWALNAQLARRTLDKMPLKFIVPSYYSNPNLNAQKGVLTHWEIEIKEDYNQVQSNGEPSIVDRTPFDQLITKRFNGYDSAILSKIELPAKDCFSLFRCINRMGYGASKLFPGYAGVVKEIEEKTILSNGEWSGFN